MKKKKFALMTGLLSAVGLLALVGHKHQVKQQELEENILKEIRHFFAPMGEIKVVYQTSFDASKQLMLGGVVFSDDVVFTYRYEKGIIDYKLEGDMRHVSTEE